MKPLRAYLDASGHTWHDVPGYGRVNWPIDQITAHARFALQTHRPARVRTARRILWPVRVCKVCALPWMCREALWAVWWFDSLERGWRLLVEARAVGGESADCGVRQ